MTQRYRVYMQHDTGRVIENVYEADQMNYYMHAEPLK